MKSELIGERVIVDNPYCKKPSTPPQEGVVCAIGFAHGDTRSVVQRLFTVLVKMEDGTLKSFYQDELRVQRGGSPF